MNEQQLRKRVRDALTSPSRAREVVAVVGEPEAEVRRTIWRLIDEGAVAVNADGRLYRPGSPPK